MADDDIALDNVHRPYPGDGTGDAHGDDDDAPRTPRWLAPVMPHAARLKAHLQKPLTGGLTAGVVAFLAIAFMLPPVSAMRDDVVAPIAIIAAPAIAEKDATQGGATNATTNATLGQPPAEETAAPPAAAVPVIAELAVVVADAGLNRRVTQSIDRALPRETTLAVSVYANDPAGTAAALRGTGRDMWLQLASQSIRPGIDPGPLAVTAGQGVIENQPLVERQIALGGGNVVGVFIPSDADVTAAEDMWRDLATAIIGKNLLVLDATKAKVAVALYMQKSKADISAYLKTDIVLSGDMGPAALKKALAAALPEIIKKQQATLVLNRPTVLAVETLAAWMATLPDKGVRLVPASSFTGLASAGVEP